MEQNFIYEKISDDIYWMGNIILRFNVVLGSSNNGYRKPFHQEYMYSSKKYKDCENLVTIRRHYDYFLSLENASNYTYTEKEYIVIGVQDFLFFRSKIKQAASWLTDSNIYRYKDDNIVKVGNVEPITVNFISFNKTITLEPIVMRSDIGLNCAGIRITIGKNRENFTDLSVDKYMGLLYIIDTFNMQMAAMSILSYMGKTENNYSTNAINVGSDNVSNYRNQNTGNSAGKPGRFVGSNNTNKTLEDL